MKQFTKETLIDKSIDIAVVVFGILIALSIDSYRDRQKQLKQWNQFSNHFITQAQESKPEYKKAAAFFKEKKQETVKQISSLVAGKVELKKFEPFLQSLSGLLTFYPDDVHYKALVSTGNENLINNNRALKVLGNFYNFQDVVKIHLTIYSDHLMPKYLKMLELYYSKKIDLKKDKVKIIFFLEFYKRFAHQNQISYEEQIENSDNVIKLLNKK